MDQTDKKRLTKNWETLIANILVGQICDTLFTVQVIDDEMLDLLTNLPLTEKDRVRKLLLNMMKNPKPGLLDVFCKVLRESEANYGYLADLILECDVSQFDDVDCAVSNDIKREELVRTVVEQSTALMKALREAEECRQRADQLSQENRVLAERAKQLETLREKGFTDENLLNFAELFVFSNPGHFDTVDEAGRVPRATGSSRKQLFDITSLPPDKIDACKLCRDLVQYIVAKNTGQQPRDPINNHAIILREKIEDLYRSKHSLVFCGVENLHIMEINGYKTFQTIIDELFYDEEYNWGRVLAWFAFCAYLASNFKCSSDELDMYATYGWYLVDRRLPPNSLKSIGGWQGWLYYLELPQPDLVEPPQPNFQEPPQPGGILPAIIRSIPGFLRTLHDHFPSHV